MPATRLLPILALAGLAATPWPVFSQADNVNDCTLIKDPIALRDCILRYGNVRTQPPATIESTAPSAATQGESSADPGSEIVEVPSAPAGKKGKPAKRSEKTALKRPLEVGRPQSTTEAAPLARPNPNDTLTHIEQIDLSKVKR